MFLRVLLPLLLLAALLPARAVPPNLLPNGGFEDGMTGWTVSVTDPDKAGAATIIDPAQPLAGAAALRLVLPGKGALTLTSATAPVNAGRDYLLAARYRSTGFNAPGKNDVYVGATLIWYAVDAKQLATAPFAGFSTTAQTDWSGATRLITAPAGAVALRLTLTFTSTAGTTPSTLWLDQLQVRCWDPPATPAGTTTRYHVSDGYYSSKYFRVVADDATENGLAVVANPKYATTQTYLSCALYLRDLKPGTYRVTYRLKAAQLPAAEKPVVLLASEYEHGGFPNARTLLSGEFTTPGVYQDFTLRFIKTPWCGYAGFGAVWMTNAIVWADTITVVEEETYSREQLDSIFH